ncbi:DUF58 domain-containing protein [Bacillus shivajii]|uniref:DUF58 domain-containing protein n=1 Tax=Bacillus shivajii TaxID=1983719 RepID=UPI001CF97A79|nr:DUF58 domain-containing protein [Bacillus shivajii]UCZ52429.1 DUF58 domain-containing protein [Bacillus shivajii]
MKNHWRQKLHVSKFDYLLNASIPFLILLGMITSEILLISISFLFGMVILFNKWYLSNVVKQIHIIHDTHTKRLFPEDESNLIVPFENKGKLPILNGKWWFHLYDPDNSVNIRANDQINENNSMYELVFSIPTLTKRKYEIPIIAKKRGIAQVRAIEVEIFDIFRLNSIKLNYEGPFREEAIVYPSFSPVHTLKKVIQNERGSQPQRFSLYEEMMLTRGSRGYVSNDPFNRINWKASARSNELQTKIYEKVTISRWTFVVNIRDEDPLQPTINQLEEVLRQVAFACKYAMKNDIHFDLYVNLRIPKSNFGLYLPLGHGKKHLMRALEVLARIRRANMTTPIENTLHQIISDPRSHAFVFHFGTYGENEKSYYSKAKQYGIHVQRVPLNVEENPQEIGGAHRETIAN